MGFGDIKKENKYNILLLINEDVQDILEFDSNANIEEVVKTCTEKYGIKENGQNKLKSFLQGSIQNKNSEELKGNVTKIKLKNNSVERLFYDDIAKQKLKIDSNKLIKEKMDHDKECTFSPKITYSPSLKEIRKDLKIEDKLLRDGQISKEKRIFRNLMKSIEVREDIEKNKSRNNSYKIKKMKTIKSSDQKTKAEIIKKEVNGIEDNNLQGNIYKNNDKIFNNLTTTNMTNKFNFLGGSDKKFSLEKSLKLSEKGYASKFLQKQSDKLKLNSNEKDQQKNDNMITESNCQSPNSFKSSKCNNLSHITIQNSQISPVVCSHIKSNESVNKGFIDTNKQENTFTSGNIGPTNLKSYKSSSNLLHSKKGSSVNLNYKLSRNINLSSPKKSLDKISTKIDSPKVNSQASFVTNATRKDTSKGSCKGYLSPEKSINSKRRLSINSSDTIQKMVDRKESKEEFFTRLSSEKKSRSLLNNILKISQNIKEDSIVNRKQSTRPKIPKYLDEERLNSKSNLSKELSENISRKESFDRNVIESNNRNINESIKKFRLNKLKEIFEIIYKNVENIEEIDTLYKLEIPSKLIDHLIKPTCYIMQSKNLEFNFQNFYEIADEILQLVI